MALQHVLCIAFGDAAFVFCRATGVSGSLPGSDVPRKDPETMTRRGITSSKSIQDHRHPCCKELAQLSLSVLLVQAERDLPHHISVYQLQQVKIDQNKMSDCKDEVTMYYRTLGNTGMVASVLGFGFWATFGAKLGLLDREGIETAKKIMTTARNAGVNLWDNAEVCKWGGDNALLSI